MSSDKHEYSATPTCPDMGPSNAPKDDHPHVVARSPQIKALFDDADAVAKHFNETKHEGATDWRARGQMEHGIERAYVASTAAKADLPETEWRSFAKPVTPPLPKEPERKP